MSDAIFLVIDVLMARYQIAENEEEASKYMQAVEKLKEIKWTS